MIVVIAACTKDTGDMADNVIRYRNDSEQNEDRLLTYLTSISLVTFS